MRDVLASDESESENEEENESNEEEEKGLKSYFFLFF